MPHGVPVIAILFLFHYFLLRLILFYLILNKPKKSKIENRRQLQKVIGQRHGLLFSFCLEMHCARIQGGVRVNVCVCMRYGGDYVILIKFCILQPICTSCNFSLETARKQVLFQMI